MKKKILITGGAGNVGGCLARRLVMNPDNHVVIVDDLSTGSREKLPGVNDKNWRFIKADVNKHSDVLSIMTSTKFDFVFHYAAVVGVQRTLRNPTSVLDDIDGVKNILELAKNTGVKRVLFSSSSEVYGEPVETPQREATTPLNSRLPYAIVKNLAEAYCRSYQQEYGLDYTIFRFFNTYGPLQSDDFVITRFILQALKNEDITINGDGQQTRTFCFIEDNLDVTEAVIEQDLWINEVANVGSDVEITIKELAQLVIAVTDSQSSLVYLPPLKEGDMTRRKPDVSKMRKLLGRELISLERGIQQTAEYFKTILALNKLS